MQDLFNFEVFENGDESILSSQKEKKIRDCLDTYYNEFSVGLDLSITKIKPEMRSFVENKMDNWRMRCSDINAELYEINRNLKKRHAEIDEVRFKHGMARGKINESKEGLSLATGIYDRQIQSLCSNRRLLSHACVVNYYADSAYRNNGTCSYMSNLPISLVNKGQQQALAKQELGKAKHEFRLWRGRTTKVKPFTFNKIVIVIISSKNIKKLARDDFLKSTATFMLDDAASYYKQKLRRAKYYASYYEEKHRAMMRMDRIYKSISEDKISERFFNEQFNLTLREISENRFRSEEQLNTAEYFDIDEIKNYLLNGLFR
jgi:hypothetical protein